MNEAFNFRVTLLAEPDEEGFIKDADSGSGQTYLTFPFDASNDVAFLRSEALEAFGMDEDYTYNIVQTETGDFVLNDVEGNPFMTIELVEDESELLGE